MLISFLYILLTLFFGGLFGALMGLIPFFVGKNTGKPKLGMLGFRWCIGLGVVSAGTLAVPVAVGFLVALIVRDRDYTPGGGARPGTDAGGSPPPLPPVNTHLGVTCLAGSMQGQTVPISGQGLIFGRDHDCAIRFPADSAGISRHHCALRWQDGELLLTDLGSTYGTFLADGRKLPPQCPARMTAGTVFFLGSQANLFQIVITG